MYSEDKAVYAREVKLGSGRGHKVQLDLVGFAERVCSVGSVPCKRTICCLDSEMLSLYFTLFDMS